MMEKTMDKYANGKPPAQKKWKRLLLPAALAAFDFLAVCAAYFLALWLRFDFVFSKIETKYLETYGKFILFYAAFAVLILWLFRLYRALLRYVGLRELVRTFEVSVLLSVLHAAAITLIFERMPISYYIGGAVFQAMFLIGIRFSSRLLDSFRSRRNRSHVDCSRVMLIGAGNAG